MLFMIISSPRPEPPSTVRPRQSAFWTWLGEMTDRGVVQHCWSRVGRGVVMVVDVDSHEALHLLLTQWSEYVPAAFDVHPIMSKDLQEGIARRGAGAGTMRP
jgi:muconolactone delta-isomerase